MSINEKIENLKGKLIVSCQALPNLSIFATFLLLAMIGIPMGVTGYGYHKHSMPCPNLIKSTKYDSLA